MADQDRGTDERIRDEVREVLEQHPYVDTSDIELEVEEGVVVLTGTVEDRRMKKRVQEAIEELPGVRDVENQLRVSQGRLNESLNDLSATGTTTGRGTTGAAGSVPPREPGPSGRKR